MSATPNRTTRTQRASIPLSSPPLSIVQHNCLWSCSVFLSLFNSFKNCNLTPQIVTLQDPPVWKSRLPSFRLYKSFSPPTSPNNWPRVATYIYQDLLSSASILPVIFDRLDTMAIDIHSYQGLFGTAYKVLRLYNSNSVNSTSSQNRTLSPTDLFHHHSFSTITLWDFNLHHPLPDPLRERSAQDINISAPYFERAAVLNFSLIHRPAVYTHFSFDSQSRPCVLDLAFVNREASTFIQRWETSLPSTGSDNVPISIKLSSPLLHPLPPSPNWAKADWKTIKPALATLKTPPSPRYPPTTGLLPG